MYLERDFGAQYLVVCSPPLDNAGYPLARRPFSVLRSLISPAARTCPIKHVTLLALAGSVRGDIAPARTRPLLALRYLPRHSERRRWGDHLDAAPRSAWPGPIAPSPVDPTARLVNKGCPARRPLPANPARLLMTALARYRPYPSDRRANKQGQTEGEASTPASTRDCVTLGQPRLPRSAGLGSVGLERMVEVNVSLSGVAERRWTVPVFEGFPNG